MMAHVKVNWKDGLDQLNIYESKYSNGNIKFLYSTSISPVHYCTVLHTPILYIQYRRARRIFNTVIYII